VAQLNPIRLLGYGMPLSGKLTMCTVFQPYFCLTWAPLKHRYATVANVDHFSGVENKTEVKTRMARDQHQDHNLPHFKTKKE